MLGIYYNPDPQGFQVTEREQRVLDQTKYCNGKLDIYDDQETGKCWFEMKLLKPL
jgi:hypothetical protein